jgi:hypothetical protein
VAPKKNAEDLIIDRITNEEVLRRAGMNVKTLLQSHQKDRSNILWAYYEKAKPRASNQKKDQR